MRISSYIVALVTLLAIWIIVLISFLTLKDRYKSVDSWLPVSANIEENTSKSITIRRDSDYNGTQYHKSRIGSVVFSYIVEGEKYKGTKASANSNTLPESYDFEQPLAYYNPKHPKIAVLIRDEYDGGWRFYIVLLIPAVLVGAFFIRRNLLNWT